MNTLMLAEAKGKRSHIKTMATRLKTFLDNFRVEQGSKYDISERKLRLAELWTQFDAIQSIVETLENPDSSITDKETLLDLQIKQRDSFKAPYFALMSRYEATLEQLNPSETQAATRNTNNRTAVSRETHVRLPKIELPVFAGSYEDWYSYRDTFEKLIHENDRLADIEKFHYLRSSLKDKAAEVIKSIETTTENYHEAWAAVKERFDNKRWIVQRHIRAIFDTPALVKENHAAMRELLDTIFKHV
ncbi:PREDICTED: uncharacterized protein LOC108768170 [Trachymyrmex cornetzi]|uniref:uncharacterized protein LOC108768170 n=1 Tax=Trachymyrmex cornetzi TaxID=471704 RepID=UPI00084EEB5F|nr:PREDICTED: uncharacterized protein LOC108768170 [Trachymyrmex cornetzi]